MTSAKAWVAAIFAALSAGLSSIAIVLIGDMTLADLTQAQWVGIASAVLAAFGGGFGLTWATSNKPAAVPADDVVAEIGRRLGGSDVQ